MTFYKCNVCGKVVEVIKDGEGTLVCCNQEMEKLTEKYEEGNKHVPVIIRTNDTYIVKVGNVPHPMEENHYISMIELEVDGVKHRKTLKPGDKPEARFNVPEGKIVKAIEYCTIHGLWRSKQ